ncbi:unnamed protein product [Closterium sp. NIES-53]
MHARTRTTSRMQTVGLHQQGAAVEVVEAVEVVAVVGVVAGVGALVEVVVAAVGVAVVAAVGVVAAGMEIFNVEVLAVARGSGSCPYIIRTGDCAGQTCGKPHTQHRCFARLDVSWRLEFGDEAERPRWAKLLRSGVAIFDLDYDAILAAMYALSVSAEGDCYLCVPPDPGIEAAALGAGEAALPGTMPAETLHTFTLDSGASRCFFRNSTTLTPLSAPVPVRLAVPSGGPVLAHSSTVLPCPAVPSGSLSGLHLPSFSTNFVSTAALQDAMVTTTTPGGQRVSICTCTQMGLATFTRRPGSRLYTLATEPPQVAASAQVSVSGQPRVSLPETSPTPRWTGKVGDASVFRVWGSRAFVRDLSADKLSTRAIPCDVTFDEPVPFYRLFPYRSAPPPPQPLFLAPSPPLVDPLPPEGPAPSGVSQVDPLPRTVPTEVAVDSGAARGAESEGAGSGGAEPGGAEPGGAEPTGVESGGAEPEVVDPGGAESRVTEPRGSPAGALPRLSPLPEPLSPQQLREWFAQCTGLRSGATNAGDFATGDSGAGGAGVTAGASGTGGAAAAGPGGARTRSAGAAGTSGVGGAGARESTELGAAGTGGTGAGGAGGVGAGAGGTGAGGAGAGGTGAVNPVAGGARAEGAVSRGAGAGGTVRPRPYFVTLLQQVLGVTSSPGLTPPLLCPPPDQSQLLLQPASALPSPSPYTEQVGGLTERRVPASRPASPVRPGRRIPRPCPPPVPGTHAMALRPSSVPLRVPLPAPPESSLPVVPDPESVGARAASPTTSRLLATVVSDPSFESTAASALVAELCALGTDVLEDMKEDFECLAAAVPRFASMLLAPEGDPDAPDIPRVKRPPGSPPAFKVRYVARGFSQRQEVDYFQTFSPTPKMTTHRVLLHVAAQRDYELHSLDFSTAFLQGSLHEEIWLRRPPGFTGSFPAGTQWSLRRPVYGLHQARHEWHDTLRTTLAALGFTPSTADPSLFLSTDTSLPPFYVLVYVDDLVFATADTEALTLVKSSCRRDTIALTWVLQRFGFQFSSPQPTPLSTSHSLSAPPSDESVEPSGPYPELVGCLMYLMTCTRPDLGNPLSLLARYVAPGRHRKVHWDAAKRVLRYLCSTSGMGLVLGGRGPVVLTSHADASWVDDSATQRSSSCEAEIYAGAMAAQELCWLTYLLTDLGEQSRSPLVLDVDNKAMIALCQENRLEHRTKHIALRYFLARELQQRGQLRLAYVATRANTADIFTKALPPGDHQCFSTVLVLVPTLPHLLTA